MTESDTRRPISIWQPAERGGESVFVRPAPGPFGDHYSTRRVLTERRRRAHRLCLLGESTAAGYLLAPHLTPAEVLELRLGDDWEVVDLARTNERLDTMLETAEQSLQLAPDRLVVFCGNNWNLLETPSWSPYLPSGEGRRQLAERLRLQGPSGPARAAAADLRHKAEATFAHLTGLDVPVTVVVPEVNLADWESPQPVGWLRGQRVARWYELLAAARRAHDGGETIAARALVVELLRLDGGSVSTGLRLLSRIAAAIGDLEEARTAARGEVDTVRYAAMALLPAPQATATVQELLRQAAYRHGFDVVDLPRVLGRVNRLPGRDLFYDYCHLTPEGIDLAMTAVAASLVESPTSAALELSPRARAIAELGAAVHGVHRGLEGEPVRFWLKRALESDPGAVDLLLDLVTARSAPVPAVLAPRQVRDPWLTPQHGWGWQHLDAELIAAAGEVLGWERVRPRLGPPRVELWTPLDRFYPEAMEHDDLAPPLFFRSPWPWSRYCVVAAGPTEIELVARLPEDAYPGGGQVEAWLGGEKVDVLALGNRWTRHLLRLPCRPGLNRLVLCWPLPAVAGERLLEEATKRLAAGHPADLHPVFGEVLDLSLHA